MPSSHTDHPRPRLALVAVVALLAMLVAACGDGDDEPVVTGDATEDPGTEDPGTEEPDGDDPGTGDGQIEHPEGEELVLQVERTGGFVPADTVFGTVPPATLLGDGTLILEGAQIAIHPPPLLPPLFEHQIDEASIQRILAAADEAGLLAEPADYGRPNIADAQTTVVRVRAGGVDATHEIYALDIPPGPGGDVAGAPGVSEEQQERRDRVGAFVGSLLGPSEDLVPAAQAGEQVPFEADRFAIRARPADPAEDPAGEPADEPGEGAPADVEPEVRDWPLDGLSLADATECLVVDGDAAGQLAEVLADADTLTWFRQDGEIYDFQVRPLLPNENGCEDLADR